MREGMSRRILLSAAVAVAAFLCTDAATAKTDFDRDAAVTALSAVNVQTCKPRGNKAKGAPSGDGHVIVTFAPSGAAEAAFVDRAPFQGTAVGKCIEGQYRRARVPAFGGPAINVGKNFRVD